MPAFNSWTGVDSPTLDARYAPFSVRTFGAVGDGVTNDTTAVQAATDAAQAVGGTVYFPPGTYLVDGIRTAVSLLQPNFVGDGSTGTTIKIASGGYGLRIWGVSGRLMNTVISDLSVTSESGGNGIELRGVCGVTVERVRFYDLTTALFFHNAESGLYTEFCVASDCKFEGTVELHIYYAKTFGDVSFHGSGFRDCTFAQAAADTGSKIIVADGCLVYNAPWHGTFFASATANTPFILNQNATYKLSVFGTIRVEGASGTNVPIVSTAGNDVYLTGNVTGLGPYSYGDLILVESADIDGSYNVTTTQHVNKAGDTMTGALSVPSFSSTGVSQLDSNYLPFTDDVNYLSANYHVLRNLAGDTEYGIANSIGFNTALGYNMTERTDPDAPAANTCVVYAKDNGSGKTQLCVRFPTGAVQVLATEP
jgi:hypothetical protein